jgi:hypothetical protein
MTVIDSAPLRGLPRRARGRPSPAAQARYEHEIAAFVAYILERNSRLDFQVSARGWGYIAEGDGLIGKGEIDDAEDLVNDLRKAGRLPLGICAEDQRRAVEGIQQIDGDIAGEIAAWERGLRRAAKNYTPVGFWERQTHYVEMVVEKVDLKSLFKPVCDEFYVPIQNAVGWSDLWLRAGLIIRFYEHWLAGRTPVRLYGGDHDPAGLNISAKLRSNLRDLAGAAALRILEDKGYAAPSDRDIEMVKNDLESMIDNDLVIDRFGLNADFIDRLGLTWIDNLETSSGGDLADPRHPDHDKPYVQGYIARFGVRKCEANAMVVQPEAGRQLCREAILRYIPEREPRRYRLSLEDPREALQTALSKRFGLDRE